MDGLERADHVANRRRAGEDVGPGGRDLAHHKAPVEPPVELREGVAAVVAAGPLAGDDIDLAGLQAGQELDHQLRWLLQVGCHHRDALAQGQAHPGADRREGAEVARVLDHPGAEIAARPAPRAGAPASRQGCRRPRR